MADEATLDNVVATTQPTPAPETEQVPEQVKPQVQTPTPTAIPSRLRMEALALNIPEHVIDNADPDELFGFVLDRRQQQPAQTPAAAPAPEPEEEVSLPASLAARLDEDLAAYLKEQAKASKRHEREAAKLRSELTETKQQQTTAQELDLIESAFDAYPPELKKFIGEGTRGDVSENEMAFRKAVLGKVKIMPGDSSSMKKRKIIAAGIELFGGSAAPTPTPEAKPGKPRLTAEDYAAAAVTNPSHKPMKSLETAGSKAKEIAQEWLKKHVPGYQPAAPDDTLDNMRVK